MTSDGNASFPCILRGPSSRPPRRLQPRWSPGFAPGHSPARPDVLVLAMENNSETAMAPGSADSASVPSTPPTARQDEGLSPRPTRVDEDHLAMPPMTAMPTTMLRCRPRRLRPRPRRLAPNGTHDGLAARFPHMGLAEATPGASDFVPIQSE